MTTRGRGPLAGDGGRKPKTLQSDPDRFVICAMLWLRFNGTIKRPLNAHEIRMFDLLFSNSTKSEIEGIIEKDCIGISFLNSDQERATPADIENRHATAAPGKPIYWRSRIDALRKKLEKNWLLIDPDRKVKKTDRLNQSQIDDAMWIIRSCGTIDLFFADDIAIRDTAPARLELLGWGQAGEIVAARVSAIVDFFKTQSVNN
jgi:hypothetical protein